MTVPRPVVVSWGPFNSRATRAGSLGCPRDRSCERAPVTAPGPATDGDIPDYLASLGVPGLADVHVHFLPEPMLRKVWAYFDGAQEHYGTPWPITYRFDEATRLAVLRGFGVRAIPALTYPHKPGMARWLNAWCRAFAERVPDSVHCATLFPEPDVADYVAEALVAG